MAGGVYLLIQNDATWWPLASIYIVAVALMLTYDLGPETKTKGLIGNVSISLMVAAVILYGAATVDSITRLSFLVAGVVFFTNLAREIVKDCQDMLADAGERYTLPMKIGLERARIGFGRLVMQTPAILVLITLNGPLFQGQDVLVSGRIRVAMLLGLMGFILTMFV